jgi:calcineurin-like phosphoesterase family protein
MLGDVCWSGHHKEILPRLNGNKILIKGNHDKTAHFKGNLVQVIYDTKMIEVECQRIWLSHYAHRSWNCSFHGSWHLYGHSHGMLEDYGLSTDVGVDCWDFYPVSFEEIKQHMKGKERWRTC